MKPTIKITRKNNKFYISTGGGVYLNERCVIDSSGVLGAYPIGSIYLSVNNTSPASLFGGTWEQVAEGYTLWSTTTSGEGGKTISAGLPNITGSFQARGIGTGINYVFREQKGAFLESSKEGISLTTAFENVSKTHNLHVYEFNANASNSIYGNSNTVQPPAIKTYMWIRIS